MINFVRVQDPPGSLRHDVSNTCHQGHQGHNARHHESTVARKQVKITWSLTVPFLTCRLDSHVICVLRISVSVICSLFWSLASKCVSDARFRIMCWWGSLSHFLRWLHFEKSRAFPTRVIHRLFWYQHEASYCCVHINTLCHICRRCRDCLHVSTCLYLSV